MSTSATATEKPDAQISPEARAAAQWWADHIRWPVRPMAGAQELDSMLASMPRPTVTAAQADRFEDALAREIDAQKVRVIAVDYGPDTILADTARAVGIKPATTTFPVKSVMYIESGRVHAAAGYGSPLEMIYPAPKEHEHEPGSSASARSETR